MKYTIDQLWGLYREFSSYASRTNDMSSEVASDFLSYIRFRELKGRALIDDSLAYKEDDFR